MEMNSRATAAAARFLPTDGSQRRARGTAAAHSRIPCPCLPRARARKSSSRCSFCHGGELRVRAPRFVLSAARGDFEFFRRFPSSSVQLVQAALRWTRFLLRSGDAVRDKVYAAVGRQLFMGSLFADYAWIGRWIIYHGQGKFERDSDNLPGIFSMFR